VTGFGVAEGGVRALIAGATRCASAGALADEDVVAEVSAALVAAVARRPPERTPAGRGGWAGRSASGLALSRGRARRSPIAASGFVAAPPPVKADGPVRIGDDATVVQVSWSRSWPPGGAMGNGATPGQKGVRVSPVDCPRCGQPRWRARARTHGNIDRRDADFPCLASAPFPWHHAGGMDRDQLTCTTVASSPIAQGHQPSRRGARRQPRRRSATDVLVA